MCEIICAEHISVSYKHVQALNDLSFKVQKGEIFGFLGPSGAGKTTTIKLLTKQLRVDSGQVSLFSKSVAILDEELYQNIGILSDNSGLYEKMSVYDNLRIFAELRKIPETEVVQALKKTGLYEVRKKKAKDLSKGMRHRLLFCRSILHKPILLFLDEPTSALDPATSEVVHDMIRSLNEEGTTIFLTTHNMNEADELCDRVAFLDNGSIVEIGTPNELKLKYAKNKVSILSDTGDVYEVSRDKQDIIKAINEMKGNVLRINSIEPDLKTIFLDVTGREL